MPLYDTQTTTKIDKDVAVKSYFVDGAFYTWLKYMLNYSTSIPNENIYLKNNGEGNPFLEQGSSPKIFCELYEYSSPAMTGKFNANGDFSILMHARYRIYFVNDSYRAPVLFESCFKGNADYFQKVSNDFVSKYQNEGISLSIPRSVSMRKNRTLIGTSVYPIINYDVELIGRQTHNIDRLKNVEFDNCEGGIHLIIK